MNNYALFSVTSLNISTQHILFLNNESKPQHLSPSALFIKLFFCNTTEFPINIRFFFSLKTKRTVQDQRTLSIISQTVSSTSQDYIFYSIFKHTRKNWKSKVKIKYNWLKTKFLFFSKFIYIHSMHPLLFAGGWEWGLNFLINFQKCGGGGSLTGSSFIEWGCWEKGGGWLFSGCCSFYRKKQTKNWNISFNDKKSLNVLQRCFSLS